MSGTMFYWDLLLPHNNAEKYTQRTVYTEVQPP